MKRFVLKDLEADKEEKRMIFAARRQLAKEKLLENTEYNHKKKVFLIHKWDIIRLKKKEADIQVRQMMRATKRNNEIARHLFAVFILKYIHGAFKQKRMDKMDLMSKRLISRKI